MAKEGQKRRLEDNKKKLALYLQAACVSLVVHGIIRFSLRFQSSGFWHVVGAAAGAAALVVSYRTLERAAEPTYGPAPTFELLDAGTDLCKASPGTGVPKDVLWAVVILLPVAALTDWAWWLAAALPVYAAWGLLGGVLGPLLRGRGGGSGDGAAEESDAERKRREKAEKRSERRRIKRI